MTTLTSVSRVIEVLGGTQAMTQMLRVTGKAVSNWRTSGKLPASTYLAIKAALKRRGYDAPNRLWTMRPASALPPAAANGQRGKSAPKVSGHRRPSPERATC